jgi:hypothetical protein
MDSIAHQTQSILEFATRSHTNRRLQREWGPAWYVGTKSGVGRSFNQAGESEVADSLFPGLFEKEPVVKEGWMGRIIRFLSRTK